MEELEKLFVLLKENNKLLKENNIMLRQIIQYININIANKDNVDFEDFMRNVWANVLSNHNI